MRAIKLSCSIFCVFVLVASFASADTFEVASFTFDDALGATTVTPAAPNTLFDFSSFNAQFIPVSNEGNDFDGSLSTGELLFGNSGIGGLSVVLGDNIDRGTIELAWGGAAGVTNRPGDDFVVYENGSPGGPEAYMVAVRETGTATFSSFRYEFADDAISIPPPGTDIAQVLSTGFDLSSFGLASGATIDAIQIANLTELDTVDNAIGQGVVIIDGGSGFAPLTGPQGNGGGFNVFGFDADITYVGVIPGAAVPGDFDGDGDVDGDDFLIWQAAFQTNANGDADGDGDTDGDDFLIWQANFGGGVVGAAAGVPEPGTGILAMLCLFVIALAKTRRR